MAAFPSENSFELATVAPLFAARVAAAFRIPWADLLIPARTHASLNRSPSDSLVSAAPPILRSLPALDRTCRDRGNELGRHRDGRASAGLFCADRNDRRLSIAVRYSWFRWCGASTAHAANANEGGPAGSMPRPSQSGMQPGRLLTSINQPCGGACVRLALDACNRVTQIKYLKPCIAKRIKFTGC